MPVTPVAATQAEETYEHVANPTSKSIRVTSLADDQEFPEFGRVEGPQHVSGCIDRHAISKIATIVKVARKMGHSHEPFAEHLVPHRGARTF